MATKHPQDHPWEITPQHPVPLELANSHPAFVEKARAYQWHQHRPDLPVPASGWPPGWRGAYGVYDYWYSLVQRNRMARPYDIPEPTTLQEAVSLALQLANEDPLAQGNVDGASWVTVRIAGKDHFIRADNIVGYSKFAATTWDVTLNDYRQGVVDDANFLQKLGVA